MKGLMDDILTEVKDDSTEYAPSNKHLEMMIEQIYSKDNLEVKTRLNQKQINVFSKALIFAEKFNVGILNDYVMKNFELLISLNGEGRKEFTTIAGNMTNDAPMGNEKSLFDRLIK